MKSSLQPSVKSCVTSRRSCATSLSTSNRKCLRLPRRPRWRSRTSFPTARSSPSATNGSAVPRLCSSRPSWAWSRAESTRRPTTRSWSATWTSVRTSTPTRCCREALPCTRVSPAVCKKRFTVWRRRSGSRLWPLPSANTLSGSVAPSWPRCRRSSRCGSRSRSTTSRAPPSSTANASKLILLIAYVEKEHKWVHYPRFPITTLPFCYPPGPYSRKTIRYPNYFSFSLPSISLFDFHLTVLLCAMFSWRFFGCQQPFSPSFYEEHHHIFKLIYLLLLLHFSFWTRVIVKKGVQRL